MKEYMAYIKEGKTDRVYTATIYGTPKAVARAIIEDANVRDGADVMMAYMTFDPTAKTFKTVQFTFDVIDGKEDNLVAL